MKKLEYVLTGEGFTREEADEIFKIRKKRTMTREQRREYLISLRRATTRRQAKVAPAADDQSAR